MSVENANMHEESGIPYVSCSGLKLGWSYCLAVCASLILVAAITLSLSRLEEGMESGANMPTPLTEQNAQASEL